MGADYGMHGLSAEVGNAISAKSGEPPLAGEDPRFAFGDRHGVGGPSAAEAWRSEVLSPFGFTSVEFHDDSLLPRQLLLGLPEI
jgi:hypothetical protein